MAEKIDVGVMVDGKKINAQKVAAKLRYMVAGYEKKKRKRKSGQTDRM